jgi:CBS domain-containing protein
MFISDVLRNKGHRVEQIRSNQTVAEAVRELAEHKIGALVVEDDWMRVAGIFSERDFVNAVAREGATALTRPVSDLMSSPVITCVPSDRIDTVLAKMTVARVRHMPVVENGHLLGIVSIGDLVKHRSEEKELEANVLLEISRLKA